jgi:endothelin-converting enzyme
VFCVLAPNGKQFSYNPMTPMELDQLVPQISISKYLKAQAPPTYDVKTVIVSTVDYYKNLSSIIRSADRQTLHDYLQWRLIEVWGLRLHNDFNRPLRRFANIMAGKDPDAVPVRWRTCLKEVDFGLGWIESGFFVQRAFGPQSKEFGDRIIHDIKDMFTERFKGLDWMSDTVKTVAAKKGEFHRFLCIL